LAAELVSAIFAYLVAAMPRLDGRTYYCEIILPGSILGLIVGYATQRFGADRQAVVAR
jgi:hypothetical protein